MLNLQYSMQFRATNPQTYPQEMWITNAQFQSVFSLAKEKLSDSSKGSRNVLFCNMTFSVDFVIKITLLTENIFELPQRI